MQAWDKEVDFLVVGSGAGGMTAAITAHQQGLDTLLIEKSEYYGGTSALSGGVIWIPDNPHMARADVKDSEEDAMRYLEQVASEDVDRDKLRAFVRRGPEMLRFIEQHSLLKYDPAPVYPDYYPELQGGKPGARSLDPRPYTMRAMGIPLCEQMRTTDLDTSNGFAMTAAEAHLVFSFTWRSPLIIFKCLLRYWLDMPSRIRKLPDNRLTLGRALIGRLRHTLAQKGIPLWLKTSLVELVQEDGQIIGAVCEQEGKRINIRCKKGVLLASGGFAHNLAMRQQYHPKPTDTAWTAASAVDTGDGIRIGEQHGGQVAMMGNAWWSPSMVLPGGTVEAFIVGKSMPSCMAVNKAGKRFCNEAEPYEDFVKHQYAAHSEENPCIPAYFVFDSRYRHEYPLGTALAPGKFMPDAAYKSLFDKGWIKKADTLEELAVLWGIDPDGLKHTADRISRFSKTGEDEDFGKGRSLNDRYYSDHRIKPNPCLAPLDKPPFYAVQIWPGDLGTKGGLLTNEHSQVLDKQNRPIDGLYACGNASASVMGNSYPGAGSTLGPAMTFAYIAVQHAAGQPASK